MVIPFLRRGLESHEACLWVVSRTIGVLEAIEALQRGYDLTPFLGNGQLLVVPAEQWYLDRGQFSERKAFQKLKKFIEDREHRGYRHFRGVGDLAWLEGEDWPAFQLFEKKVHQWIQEFGLTAVCAYPIQQCSVTQTKDVLDHHDSVFQTKL